MSIPNKRYRDAVDGLYVKQVANVVLVGIDKDTDSILAYGINPATSSKEPLPVRGSRVPIAVDEDNVGLATSADILALQQEVSGLKGGDGRTLTDIYDRLGEALPRYARLQIYDSATGTWKNVVDSIPVTGTVNVGNLPTEYPLPSSQLSALKSKVRIMAWNPTNSAYELIEGYEGQKDFTYDSNGNLTEIRLTVILYDGRTRTVRRTLAYDANGNLTSVSRWEVVS